MVIVAAAVLAAAGVAALLRDGDAVEVAPAVVPTPPGPAAQKVEPVPDPFAYDPDRREEFEARAAAGHAHVLYARSPGGAIVTAERVARWRPKIDATAEEAGVDPELLEGLVFLESAGREDAVTPIGIEGAVGLTQIVAQTATGLLGMRVDVGRSRRLTRRIERSQRRDPPERVARLRAKRARVDERFDPDRALAGTARYLQFALDRLEREDLGFVSYHMGVGNLEAVLDAYGSRDVPYAQVYFDSTPLRHADAYRRLAGLGDDSANYLWKLLAARDIMRLYRTDPVELRRLAALHGAKNSAEEVLHPEDSTERFATPADLRDAWDDGRIVAFPADPATTGLRIDRRMGELSSTPSLYRGLRPESMALLLYAGAQTRAAAGDPAATLTVTSTVRDAEYQARLARRNREATRNYSLHTTGWSFDVLRRYRSRRHARAFQFVLERLQSLNLIAWVREPAAIHVTASPDTAALLPLLDAIQAGP